MEQVEVTPYCGADIIRCDYLALLVAAIDNFYDGIEDGRDRNELMQRLFIEIAEHIISSTKALTQEAGTLEPQAFLVEQYLPKLAAFFHDQRKPYRAP